MAVVLVLEPGVSVMVVSVVGLVRTRVNVGSGNSCRDRVDAEAGSLVPGGGTVVDDSNLGLELGVWLCRRVILK